MYMNSKRRAGGPQPAKSWSTLVTSSKIGDGRMIHTEGGDTALRAMASAAKDVAEKEESLLQAYTIAAQAHAKYLLSPQGAENVKSVQRTLKEIENRRNCLAAMMKRPRECDAVYDLSLVSGPGPSKTARRACSRAIGTPATATPSTKQRPMGYWASGSGAEEKKVIEAGAVICEKRRFDLFCEADASMHRFVGDAFLDPLGFTELTMAQKKEMVEWVRASKLPGAKMTSECLDIRRIKQGFSLANCSVVASLITCVNWEVRFGSRLVSCNIFPQDDEGNPVLSPSGRYAVRLFLNGAPRLVEVDDFLPRLRQSFERKSATDEMIVIPLACASVVGQEAQNLWIPLIEKAIVKVGGEGYQTPGSTTTIDVFWLTGWVPEAWELKDVRDDTPEQRHAVERMWSSLYGGLAEGHAVFSTGPEDVGGEAARRTGLEYGHAYAITDAFESSEGIRLVRLQNPWNCRSWKGPYSPTDVASWTPNLLSEVGMVDCNVPPWVEREADDGTFWIPWEYIKWRFMSIHANWNPAFFPFSACAHGSYPKRVSDADHVRHNPQYLFEIGEGEDGDIVLVLHRHYKDDTYSVKDPLSMAIHVYEGTGRVYAKEGVKHSCTYRNSPYNTMRIPTPADGKSSTYVLCVGLWFDIGDLNFTISAFSRTRPLSISKAPPAPGFPILPPAGSLVSKSSLWSKETSGGGTSCTDSYHKNPQFAIRVQKSGEVMIILELLPSSEEVDDGVGGEDKGERAEEVGFEVVRGNGARVTALNAPALTVKGGGGHSRKLAFGVFNLGEGVTYTVVANTKQKGRVGRFELSAQAKNGKGVQLAELSEGSSHNPISGEPPWASSATSEVGFGHDDAAAASLGKVVEVQAEISSMSSGGADDVLVAEISSLSSGGGLGVDEADGDEAAHGGDSSLKGGQEVRESVEVGGCTDANDASSPGHSDGQDAPLINPKIGGRRRKRGFLVGAVVAPKAGHPVSPLPVSGGASGPGDAGRGMHVSLAPQSPSPTLPSDASGSSHPESPADNLKHLSPRPPPGAVLM